jgi:TRAP-type C4-dicarboxylate transport system substrate-binding protein
MRLVAGALGLLLGLGVAGAVAQPVVMRISHQVPTVHHLHKILQGFEAEVEQASGGAIEVQLFPSEQLFKANDNHPAVARGALEAALSVNFQWGASIPEANVTTIPFLLTDLRRIEKWPGSEAAQLVDKKMAGKGVRNIAWLYITRQAIFTSDRKPLRQPADFAGIKIRGFNAVADAGLAAVGARPMPMAAPEVYQALQLGTLDAGLTDLSAAVSRRFYEVQKYGTVAPYNSVFFQLYVNPRWFDGLKLEHRAAIEAAARNAEKAALRITEETAKAAVGQLQEHGMTVHMQTAEETKAWTEAMQKPAIDAFLKAAPEDGPRLLELLGKLN